MQAEDITYLLDKIGCNRIRQNMSGWVNASCPFAPFTKLHKTREDKSSSFGIRIDDGPSHYRCFTCNAKGSVLELLTRLRSLMTTGGHDTTAFSDIFQWVLAKDRDSLSSTDILKAALERAERRPTGPMDVGGIRLSAKTAQAALGYAYDVPETVLAEDDLLAFDPLDGESFDYLKGRGLDEKSIADWEFRWHRTARRIAIPIRDCKKRLVGISGRSLEGESKRKFLHSLGFQRDRYLYGEVRLKEGGEGTGVIVEGFFDAIHLWQHGYQGVAIMGTHVSRIQIEKLVRFFKNIVILPDGDTPGLEAADRMKDVLLTRIPTRIAKIPMNRDPDELSALELAETLGSPNAVGTH
jgi:5S rRNA maturation endonuclease (ribonuclease M5)